MNKTTVVVKIKHKKNKMTPAELKDYYEHGRGRTRVAQTDKKSRREEKRRLFDEE